MDVLRVAFVVLLVIFFPLGEVARFSLNEVAVTLTDIGVGLVSILWIMFNIFRKSRAAGFRFAGKKVKAKLFLPISIFVGVAILSLIVNLRNLTAYESLVSSLYIVRWVAYSLIYFVILDFDKDFLKKVPLFLLFAGALIVVGGFIQYFLYPDLRNLYYLGWDEHLYRMFSSFLDPNFAGTFFVLYFLLTLGLLFNNFKTKNKTKTIVLNLLSSTSLLAIFLTFSRSAYLMLFVGTITFLILQKKIKWLVIFIVLSLISIVILVKNVPQTEGTNLLRTASGESRIESINRALTIFKDNPVFGVGFNAYRYVQRDYGFINEEKRIVHSGAGTDNSFLFILATTGIVGFFSFLFLIYKIVRLSYQFKNSRYSAILLSSILALVINSFFINSMFYIFVMMWIWILIGLTENS